MRRSRGLFKALCAVGLVTGCGASTPSRGAEPLGDAGPALDAGAFLDDAGPVVFEEIPKTPPGDLGPVVDDDVPGADDVAVPPDPTPPVDDAGALTPPPTPPELPMPPNDGVPPETPPESAPALPGAIGRDRFGGLTGTGLGFRRTGFFHIEKLRNTERTWLVDPEGNPFWAVGVNTVLRSANCPDITPYLLRAPAIEVARTEWDRLFDGANGGYGYRFNNVGSFSDTNDLDRDVVNPIVTVAPFGIVLDTGVSVTAPYALRTASGQVLGTNGGATLGDIFNPAYVALLEGRFRARVRPNDPLLMYYWMANETGRWDHPNGLGGTPGVRDLRPWLWPSCPSGSTVDAPRCAPHALASLMRARYRSVEALNRAWGTAHASFEAVAAARPTMRSEVAERRCNAACANDLQRFVRWFDSETVRVTTTMLRRLDPNHLVSSPRLAMGSPRSYCFWGLSGCNEVFTNGERVPAASGDVRFAPWDLFQRRGDAGYDLVSLNAYSLTHRAGYERPWFTDGVHRIQRETGLPVLISEFGIRARIEGWSNDGGAPAFVSAGTPSEEQRRRGSYYVTDLTQFMAFRGILGASIHRWADRYLPTEQMNMGIVHRDGARWEPFDSAIRGFNNGIYSRLRAATGW
ncbi:MAG: hypothetical protein JNK72_17055 [Myxococcales bacterium]|nr:hypothetical protein [Myxococcales bacterium]